MTATFDLQKSAALPPVYIGAVADTPPGQPLTITCAGEVQYIEDDPALGTWWQQQTLTVGHCASIAEAIAFVTLAIERNDFPLDDDEALGFSPRLFVVLDYAMRLVLAGEVWGSGIRWCAPVTSDIEARTRSLKRPAASAPRRAMRWGGTITALRSDCATRPACWRVGWSIPFGVTRSVARSRRQCDGR